MCATVAEIINGKLMMTEDWNGVTLYAHDHFMVGIKKTSATVYCIWSSICNKYYVKRRDLCYMGLISEVVE